MKYSKRSICLNIYFIICYLFILGISFAYLKTISFVDIRTSLFAVAVYFSYSFIYLLPAFIITKIVQRLSTFRRDDSEAQRWISWVVYGVAIATTLITSILLFTDYTIYSIFGFHLNGFVWNLITTPGGIESMGGSESTILYIGLIIVTLISVQIALLWILRQFVIDRLRQSLIVLRKIYPYVIVLFILLTFGERITYGVSNIQGHGSIMSAADAFPCYLPMTFHKLAKKLGCKTHRKNKVKMDVDSCSLAYPLKPLEVVQPEKPLNIVWLVSESWRWDMLDPEIMPNTWAFAQNAHRFTRQYSGGNGTRMGMFAMFYGLYGTYWFPFLHELRAPVLMDVVQNQGYELNMFTSAKFTYPEFDKTIFANVPGKLLHECHQGRGWQRDKKNVTDLIEFIENRDRNRPFMTFMFFESPHARYYFPKESVIREPYLEDMNYVTMSLERDIELIKNRYINSCHYLDSQFKRVFDYLEQERLIDNTIVVMTGDHGEEFMEKGRWGHNSEFHEEQIRVPMVFWVPGTGSSQVDSMTSHIDIAPTILSLLGVKNPPEEYSLGHNLFSNKQRKYAVLCDWSRLCYVDSEYKATFPLKNTRLFQNKVTTNDDQLVDDAQGFYNSHTEVLIQLMRELSKFSRKI